MKTTTNASNNQQVIDKNLQLQLSENTPSNPEIINLKRAERRRLKRAAEKEVKQAGDAGSAKKSGLTGTRKPGLNGDQLKILQESMENLKKEMVGNTWRTLEMGRVFKQNQKIKFITDDTLVVGVGVASN